MTIIGTSNILLILSFAGLLFSVLSALENRIQWISSLCGFFGEGCKRTADFTIFKIPISWWGMAYYLCLALFCLFAKPLVFWAVIAGFGMELTFLWILVWLRIFCIFCGLNALVVGLLLIVVFDPARIWQAITVALLSFLGSHALISRENRAELASSSENEPDLLARVDGSEIREEEVERPLIQQIHRLEKKIYHLKRKRLEEMVQSFLLEKEARSKGISREELENSILKKIEEVSEEEVEHYYREKRDKWQGSEVELRKGIRKSLQKKKGEEKIQEYADSLKEEYDVEIFLQEPPLPVVPVRMDDSPALGPEDAPVVIVEFSDYLCPACRAGHEEVNKVKDKYDGEIKWVFKDLPLESHEGADKLAEAARCAGLQGKFWEYQDRLFSSDGEPDTTRLEEYAEELNLDVEKFKQCLEKRETRPLVEKDREEAKKAGISATPTFVINGKMLSGAPSLEAFHQIIDEELKK
jgi:protein-disulfide isomerase